MSQRLLLPPRCSARLIERERKRGCRGEGAAAPEHPWKSPRVRMEQGAKVHRRIGSLPGSRAAPNEITHREDDFEEQKRSKGRECSGTRERKVGRAEERLLTPVPLCLLTTQNFSPFVSLAEAKRRDADDPLLLARVSMYVGAHPRQTNGRVTGV